MSALAELKRGLGESLVRSGLDVHDDLLILNSFLHDFRWKRTSAGAREVAREWEALTGDPPAGHFLRLYVHFPYCRSRCAFCLYASSASPSRRDVALWVDATARELAHFGAAARAAPVRSFMVGGGSPSLLEEDEIEAALGPAFRAFRFEDDAFVSIECNPESVAASKLARLRRLGFKRVSMGVQSLDPAVLKSVGRGYQDEAGVARAVRAVREAGFDDLNLDLVFGFDGETRAGFRDGFRRVAALRPTSITVCGLTPVDRYLRARRTTREEFARRYQAALAPALEDLRLEARAAGYAADDLSPARGVWTLLAEDMPPALFRRLLRAEPEREDPCSVLGVGPGSRSHLFGRMLALRGDDAFDADATRYGVSRLTEKEEMAVHALYAIESLGELPISQFRRRFGRDPRETFALELAVLRAWGQADVDAAAIRFRPRTAAARIFFGQVFLLDTLAARAEGIDAALVARVRRELAPAEASR